MSITIELTYDMSKALGTAILIVEHAPRVVDAVRAVRERFGERAADFEKFVRVAGVAVNGVLINHREGMKTKLAPGDRVCFVKAAAGG